MASPISSPDDELSVLFRTSRFVRHKSRRARLKKFFADLAYSYAFGVERNPRARNVVRTLTLGTILPFKSADAWMPLRRTRKDRLGPEELLKRYFHRNTHSEASMHNGNFVSGGALRNTAVRVRQRVLQTLLDRREKLEVGGLICTLTV
jgi:hypothetical protein